LFQERRGLVFCVEDRAILCPDCDEPIHSANDLTAKHTRFLLVGAKLSTHGSDSDDDGAQDPVDSSSNDMSPVLVECSSDNDNNGNRAMISDYLTNICPGWRVDDLLFDDSHFAAAAVHSFIFSSSSVVERTSSSNLNNFSSSFLPLRSRKLKQKPGGRDEHVPSMDADLFDVVGAAGLSEKPGAWGPSSWTGDLMSFEEVPTAAMVDPTAARPAKQQGRVRETYDDSNSNRDNDRDDVFAVPQIRPPPAKRARPSSSFWCF
jgi:hypothetical protein